jgi:hypothetical protein
VFWFSRPRSSFRKSSGRWKVQTQVQMCWVCVVVKAHRGLNCIVRVVAPLQITSFGLSLA